MAAYVISDGEMRNQALFDEYRALAQASIAKHGGRYIVRGGAPQVIEGNWRPKAIVIVEFPTIREACEWYRSPDYGVALKVRQGALERNLVFVEGVSPP